MTPGKNNFKSAKVGNHGSYKGPGGEQRYLQSSARALTDHHFDERKYKK